MLSFAYFLCLYSLYLFLLQGSSHEGASRLQVPSKKKTQAPDEEGTKIRFSHLAPNIPIPGKSPDAKIPDAPDISPLRPATTPHPRPGEPKNLPESLPPAPLPLPLPAPGRLEIRNGISLIIQQQPAVSFRF